MKPEDKMAEVNALLEQRKEIKRQQGIDSIFNKLYGKHKKPSLMAAYLNEEINEP
jgi:hypothetical protein